MQVVFHADDYGITPVQSERILECLGEGNEKSGTTGLLNSLSIFANSPCFEECADLLEARIAHIDPAQNSRGLRIGLHVNLVEGSCVADPEQVPMLVDGSGMFRLGFTGLLKLSKSNERPELQRQIETEIDAQLALMTSRFPQMRDALRVDGHQHAHIIPVVFDALLASIDRSGCKLEYMRVPVESTAPFSSPSVFKRIRPVNLAKRLLLGRLWKQNLKAHPQMAATALTAAFCGVLFSGEMTADNVQSVFDRLVSDAASRNLDLEVLFHPGVVDEASQCLNPALSGFVEFSTSKNRMLEAQTLKSFRIVWQNELPTLERLTPISENNQQTLLPTD